MKMKADEVIYKLSEIARGSLLPFIKINSDGVVSFDFSQPGALEKIHNIKKLKMKRTRRVVGEGDDQEIWEDEHIEIELHDVLRALELLGKHLGLFNEKPTIEKPLHIVGFEEILERVYGNTANKGKKVPSK